MKNLNFMADLKDPVREILAFVLRRNWLSPGHYYIEAKLADGSFQRIREVCDKSVAEYWIEVESDHWVESHGMCRA